MNRESEKNPRKMEESLNLEKGELYGKSNFLQVKNKAKRKFNSK